MSLEVRIDGGAELHRLASRMRAEGSKDLAREMGAALSRATQPVRASITAAAAATMPSGYTSLLTGSLRHRMSRRLGGNRAQVILATYADGKAERRDIRSLNAGILRHPLWGRKKKWYTTSIRPDFHGRGTEDAMDAATDAMIDVVEDFAARLVK